MKEILLYANMYLEKEKVFWYVSDNCSYFSLILYWNSSSNNFCKKIACVCVKSEIVKLSLLCYIKIHWSIVHTECIWKILSYADLPNVGPLFYLYVIYIWYMTYTYIIYITFINIITYLIRKLVKYWEAVKLMVVDMSCQNSNFSLEISNFIFANKYC